MGRTVLNKHYDSAANITADKFFNGGEIIISNEVGNEGIYILNTRGDVVKIGYNGGGSSESGGTIPSGDYITGQDLRDYLHNQAYMTSADTAQLLSVIETAISELNDKVDNMSGATPYSGAPVDLSDLYDKIEVLSAATEEHIGQNTDKFQTIDERIDALSGLTAQILTEEQVRDIVVGEIAFLVSSADTMFDTLRALAEWITNDETGSAQLIADVVTAKEAISGLTERVTAVEGDLVGVETELGDLDGRVEDAENDIADIAEGLIELSGSVVEHIAQNETDLQELNEKVEAIEVPEPVSDEHIRDIAAQEVAALVSSADSMYQALQELAEWIENDESGSAQLLADVGDLKDAVSANTNNINSLSAETEALKDMVENLPIPSGSSIDENVINALKAYIDEKIAEIQVKSDHVFLSRAQYRDLVYNGYATIDGEVHYYSDNIYYCIYESGAPIDSGETSGSSYDYDEETGVIEFSGDTVVEDGIVEIAASVDEDGYVTITEAEPMPDEGPEVDEDDNLDLSDVTDGEVDEEGYLNLEMPNNWEII